MSRRDVRFRAAIGGMADIRASEQIQEIGLHRIQQRQINSSLLSVILSD
jgi:hypothetical protein